jgi:hypothetical protein
MKLLSATAKAATSVSLALALLFPSTGVHADSSPVPFLSSAQYELLSHAYKVAVQDGHKSPQIVQAILMQESKAGGIKNWRVSGMTNKPGDRYAGLCQIKLAAAKDVMKAYPDLWDRLDTRTNEELFARLVLDDNFNIEICSKYLLLMGVNTSPLRGIAAFNQGLGGVTKIHNVAEFGYTKGVVAYMKKLAGFFTGATVEPKVEAELVKPAEENVIEKQVMVESSSTPSLLVSDAIQRP